MAATLSERPLRSCVAMVPGFNIALLNQQQLHAPPMAATGHRSATNVAGYWQLLPQKAMRNLRTSTGERTDAARGPGESSAPFEGADDVFEST
jgi:hypothetical protein